MNITDRSFGYWPYADQKRRTAAMNRWIAWWQKEGRAAYVQEHPAVAPLLGPPPAAPKP